VLINLIEAGALMIGGHSVEDPEIKYGIAATGVVNPENLLQIEEPKRRYSNSYKTYWHWNFINCS